MKKALTALAVLTALTATAEARPRRYRHYHHPDHRPLGQPREPAHGRQLLAGQGHPAPGTTKVPNPIQMGIDDNELQTNKDISCDWLTENLSAPQHANFLDL